MSAHPPTPVPSAIPETRTDMSQTDPTQRPTAIMVVGMHRSGTSALAGTFDALGFSLGSDLLPANEQANAKGYFEHAQVVQVHEELLAALGMEWHDLRPLPEGWLRHRATARARERLGGLVAELVAGGGIAVIKDPRMCRFLPLWEQVLEQSGVRPLYAFIARHPVEVAASLRRRDDMSEYRSGLLTAIHQLEAEQASRGHTRVFLTYEDLVGDWRGQMARCYQAFGLGPLPVEGPLAQAVDAFLDADLRHQRVDHARPVDPLVMDMYQAMQGAGAGAPESELVGVFDRLQPQLEAARRAYVASREAALDALSADRQGRAAATRSLQAAWQSVPVEDPAGCQPVLYLRSAQGHYSQAGALAGQVGMAGTGIYQASFALKPGTVLQRLRFDPDKRPGAFRILALELDGVEVPDLASRLTVVHEHRAQLGKGIEWVCASDDPWVEFDLEGLAGADAGVAQVRFLFQALSAHQVSEEAAQARTRQLSQTTRQIRQALARQGERTRQWQQQWEAERRGVDLQLHQRLSQSEALLASMATTLEELKRRSDRPLLYRLGRRLGSGLGTALELAPLANVGLRDGLWHGSRRDPQLALNLPGATPANPGIGAGWHLLTVECHASRGELTQPQLYPDYGSGSSEEHRIDLPEFSAQGRIQTLVLFEQPLRSLRLDPTSQDASFTLKAWLQPLSKPKAFGHMLARVWTHEASRAGGRGGFLRQLLGSVLGGPRRVRKLVAQRYEASQRASGTGYAAWIARCERRPTPESLRLRLAALAGGPTLSVVMPVYKPPEKWLRRAIESVMAQSYPHWELCMADDASPGTATRKVLEEYAARDRRIKVEFRSQNGHISESSNSALALAGGQFVALLDHDDELHPDALLYMAEAIVDNPQARVLYSDEDKIDEDGQRFDPYFKPDWNYDLFLGQNCLSHLGVYDTALMRQVGGFRKGLEGSQDWDLALRCVEAIEPAQIIHVPRVLYHWRAIQGSTALGVDQKNYALEAGQRAVQEHLQRTGQQATVEVSRYNMLSVTRPCPQPAPKVSLIIPTRDRVDLLRMCIDSILERSTYPDYEILVVDNGSVQEQTHAYFRELASEPRVRVIDYPGEFNYSAINNHAARQARGQVLGLVNNDIEVITPGWMEEMVAHAMRPEIGAVGAMLYYPDNTIQHAGVMVGVGGVAAHIGSHEPRGAAGYFGRLTLTQQLSAVTAACLLVRREVFEQAQGLDEGLKVAFNDIDFCLRVRELGYRNLWTPFAELYHHESASRGLEDNPAKLARFMSEIEFMRDRWGQDLGRDPAYNPNLSLDTPFMPADRAVG
jgi:GT2 family glycosyltransferase